MRSSVPLARRLAAAALLLFLILGGRVAGQPPAGMPPAKPPVVQPVAQPPMGQPPAGQPAGRPADEFAINAAIERGVGYLRGAQTPAGSWGAGTGPGSGKGWAIGYTALAGIALIECGVPPSDPGLKKAADGVRFYVKDLEATYEVALAILFLDRMGDKKDRRAIQILATRLMAGQAPTGGWGYKVPKLSAVEHDTVIGALRKLVPPRVEEAPSVRDRPPGLGLCIKSSDDVVHRLPPAYDPEKARTGAMSGLTPAMKKWPVFVPPNQLVLTDPADRRWDAHPTTTDNSNTHFAMLAMWAARKHDVPAERSLDLLAQRFRTSQNADGSWGYDYARGGKGGGAPAMTSVALLGMAIAHVVEPDPAVRPEQDPKVVNAFAWLSARIGNPVGRTDNRPAPKDVGGLYFLWAVERVAVIFDVAKLGRKDWYLWGAEILVGHQKTDGSWEGGGFPGENPAINTSLALLFLKRANLTPDLTRRLTVDTGELVAKVDDTVKPVPTPTPPPKSDPEPEPTPPPQKTPEPTPEPKAKEPTPTPTPTPQPKTVPAAAQPQEPDDAPASGGRSSGRSKSIWTWILSAILAAMAIGRGAYYVYKKGQAPEEKPKKKKKKPKVEE